MTGPDNPKNNKKEEYTGHVPLLNTAEIFSAIHDNSYRAAGANGISGALFNPYVKSADGRLAVSNYLNIVNPDLRVSGSERYYSALTALGFTFIYLEKSTLGPIYKLFIHKGK